MGEKALFTDEEQFIVDEAPEIQAREPESLQGVILNAFPAFSYPNFRIYFVGQSLSLIGTWLQIVALGWLVYEITKSAYWVGVIAALQTAPVFIFSLAAGVVVDRVRKRDLLVVTKTVEMTLAFVLGALAILGVVNIWHIAIIAFLLGIVLAFDMPTRNAFIAETIDRQYLSSAIATSVSVYHAARVIGPAVAGILIAWVGVGGTFLINGLSYIPLIVGLIMMTLEPEDVKTHPHPLQSIKEGLIYSFSHPMIGALLVVATVASIFGWSYTTIMPVVAKEIYGQGASLLGYFHAAAGAGAVLAMIMVALYAKKIPPLFFIIWGCVMFAFSLLLFSFTTQLAAAFALLFLSGFGIAAQFVTINSTIQHHTEDALRGRVLSIYALMFVGMIPVGNLEVGYLASLWGSAAALRINGFAMLFLSIILIFILPPIFKKPVNVLE